MASPIIELKSVSMKFMGETALTNVSIQVQEGETLVLVGPSGQGKSILLKIMAGILEPTSGEVWFEGENFYKMPTTQRDSLRRRMGMLFQKNALFDSLTAAENISFPLREASDKSEVEIDAIVNGFLKEVGLEEAGAKYPDEISGGMQKRLGIARALALDPELIFYDDPTAGLDPITSRKIVDLIIRLKKQKRSTAIAITNDMNRAYQMASRMAMVVDHQILITGTPDETQNHKDPRVRQFINGQLIGPLTEPI